MTLLPRRLMRAAVALPIVVASALVGPSSAFASTHHPSSGRHVSVMTRNLYLGADLTRLLSAADPITGAAQVVATVEQSNPPKRMREIADEIARAKPDLVGLQEVADWQIPGKNPLNPMQQLVPPATYDFLALIQHRLVADHAPYRVVVSNRNFDTSTQLPQPLQALATFADRDVMLARAGLSPSQLQVLDTKTAHYAAQLTIPIASLGGVTINFQRGYEWADVKTRGKVWRVVNTHPEAYSPASLGLAGPDVNGAEVKELTTALAGVTAPIVVLGDLNSKKGDPQRAGYANLVAAGFSDTWLALGKPDSAFTCCRNETLTDTALYERIDHVFVRGDITPLRARRVGVAPESATPPLWPSDHAGVVTWLRLGSERPHSQP